MFLIWVHSYANTHKRIGLWLEDCDFEAHKGRGQAWLTRDKTKAKRFAEKGDAFEFWTTVPKRMPRRPDGKPNKPLTAYSVEILPEGEDPMNF